jgi:hypothetical protein
LREAHGQTQEIVIVADNDASGVGRNKADQASAKARRAHCNAAGRGRRERLHQSGGDLAGLLFPPLTIGWSLPIVSQSSPPRSGGKSSTGCKAKR